MPACIERYTLAPAHKYAQEEAVYTAPFITHVYNIIYKRPLVNG